MSCLSFTENIANGFEAIFYETINENDPFRELVKNIYFPSAQLNISSLGDLVRMERPLIPYKSQFIAKKDLIKISNDLPDFEEYVWLRELQSDKARVYKKLQINKDLVDGLVALSDEAEKNPKRKIIQETKSSLILTLFYLIRR